VPLPTLKDVHTIGGLPIVTPPSYTALVRGLAPYAQYPMDEASGTVVTDQSGNVRNGAYKGSGEPLLGQTGSGDGLTAPLFDASNDYANLASSGVPAAFNGAEGGVSIWVNANVDASRYAFFLSADASNQVYIRKQATANQFICVHNGGGTGKTAVLTLGLNAWYHLVWTWSATAGKALVWVNGEPGASPAAGLGTWAGTPTVAVIGASNASGASAWGGKLAHLALFAGSMLKVGHVAVLARKSGLIIFDGDSRTIGTTSPYPTQCMALTSMTAKNYSWYNSGVSGESVNDFSANAATEVDANYRSLFGAHNICVVWGGVNDANAGASAATIYSRLLTYWAARRAAGFKVVACTEIDAQDAGREAVNWHSTLYPALNTLIRSDPHAYDVLVDLGADSRLQDATNTTYFNADKVHLTDTGYSVVAALVAEQAKWL
jgi:lysophospholipase L1-like esterase